MEQRDQSYRAGLMRLILAMCSAIAVPMFLPDLLGFWPVLVGYFLVSLGMQGLIKADIGGVTRQIIGGSADAAMITFCVYITGSVNSVMIGLYPVLGVGMSTVAGSRVGRVVSGIAIAFYWTLLLLEGASVIPYAPHAGWLEKARPDLMAYCAAAFFVAGMTIVASEVVGRLATAVREREKLLVRANQRLQEQSERDPLTGLFNRRFLHERIAESLDNADVQPAALLMLDLDGFKHINDTFGHLEGDRMLTEVSKALTHVVRASDYAGRYGGDEFVVLLPDAGLMEAQSVADRIVDAVREIGERFDPEHPVTASLGIALARGGETPTHLLNRADEAAYEAKQSGGNRRVSASMRAA